MEVCAHCGRQVVAGSFCTNCGEPLDTGVDWRTGTAERPVIHDVPARQPQPPLPAAPPPPPRYPLFADDVAGSGHAPAPPAPPPPAVAPPPPAVAPPPPDRTVDRRRVARRRWALLPWVLGGAALLLVATLGVLLVVSDDDGAGEDSSRGTAERAGNAASERSGAAEPTQEPPPVAGPLPADDPVNLAKYAAVTVPATAPPNEDVNGNMVRYESDNMLDGVAETCWRMVGSGAGREIVLSFPEPATLTEIGLINGYAKRSGDLDWYKGNRRLQEVTWVFDDGTTVAQTLDEVRDPQTLEIDPVTTSSVTLRLDSVSQPGRGRASRDYTAISDVFLVGAAAG